MLGAGPLRGERLGLLLALAALAAPCRLLAEPPSASESSLSLAEAVRLTFERSPGILLAREDVALRAGALRQASGAFDAQLKLIPTFTRFEDELDPQLRAHERDRRTQLFLLNKAFNAAHKAFDEIRARGGTDLPPCPGDFGTIRITPGLGTNDEAPGLGDTLCTPIGLDAVPTSDDPTGLSERATTATLPRATLSRLGLDFETRLAGILGIDIEDQGEELRQRGLEIVEEAFRLTLEAEARSSVGLARLGGISHSDIRRSASLELDLTKPLRTGAFFQLQLKVQGSEDNFKNKPLDPRFGGKEQKNQFTSGVALLLSQPLWRGRGHVAAAGPERAAAANAEAARARYQHTVSERALDTTLAYLDLIAAQESLSLFEKSAEANRQIVDATRQLVQAGEQARSDLSRAEARLADVEVGVAGGRLSVLSARSALAQAIGLKAEEAGVGPLASGAFAPAPAEVDYADLARQAAARRNDLRASKSLRDGSRILFEAARANARRRFDLSIRVGMASDYQGPFFRVLKDETKRDPLEPRERPVDFFHPVGVWRSLKDRWEPTFSAKLTFEAPFGNNSARGRIAQSHATLQQSDIRVVDLARVIDENVTRLAGSLRHAREEVARQKEAVTQQEVTWRATRDLRAAGEISLIDALLTEQNLTSARLQLVQAQHDYAAVLARLRFEAGTLVSFRDGAPGGANLSGLASDRESE